MMRSFSALVLGLAILGAMLGRTHVSSSSPSPDVGERESEERAEDTVIQVQAHNPPQFNSLDGSMELQRNSDGHFYADVRINGSNVHMLVDTGASAIALSRDDARTAGLATSIGMNDVVAEGADGAVHGEYVRLDRVELGPLAAEGLDAIVLNSGQQSLLGQNFLSKFKSVQIEGDRMVLR